MTILLASGLQAHKLAKEQELAFYDAQLRQLLLHRSVVQAEIDLTSHIIDLVYREVTKIPPVRRRVT